MPYYNLWLQTGACAVQETETPECAAYKAAAGEDVVFPEVVSPDAADQVYFKGLDGQNVLNCSTDTPSCRIVTANGGLSGMTFCDPAA
jgi:hypothetical protein